MKIGIIIFVLVLGTLMAAVDTTIVLLALPTITTDLHTDLYTSIWVLLAYLLVLAILSTQAGRIGDIVGRSRIYNMGFLFFTLASGLCGISNNVEFLIGFRILQAAGGAMLASNSGAIVADILPPNRRGGAYGLTTLGWNVGALLGIILGGVLTTFVGWRYIFYINVPIGIIAVILGFREIKDVNKTKNKLDIPGSLVLGLLLFLISFGSVLIAGEGVSISSVLMIIVGILLIPAFILVERKVSAPIVNMRVFREKKLSYSVFANFLQGLGALAVSFLLIMYLQGVRGYSPFYSSIILSPGYIIASILAPIMGRVADRGKPGVIAGIGLIFTFISLMAYYLFLTPITPIEIILAITFITGIGSGMFWPSNQTAIMFNAPREYYGAVSGVSRTLGNIGTILSYVLTITVSTLSIPRNVAFEIFLGTNVLNGGVSSVFVDGLHLAFLISSVIVVVAAILSILGEGKTSRKVVE
ncbi:major facilitator transporter [Sulfolobus acidocaldarius SUSAZ]|nr:major facilitator transporter [Sulfolobus acidocaldarius SUSAZ]